jgi:CSLREA domain-containing protein
MITVTTTTDTVTADGLCSLREAVGAANLDLAGNGCPAGSGTDTIVLPAGAFVLSNTITLGSNLVLSGAGSASTAVDGNGLVRVFNVLVATSVEITGVKIANGRAPDGASAGAQGGHGGAVVNQGGNLTIRNSLLIDNAAGKGATGFTGSTGSAGGPGGQGGNGGAIYSFGPVTIIDSTFSGNRAGNGGVGGSGTTSPGPGGTGGRGGGGGAIFISGPRNVIVTGSTISDNAAGLGGPGGPGASNAGSAGGGGSGGGIYAEGTINLTGVRITGNSAGSGAAGQGNSLAGSAGQGGGVFTDLATLTVSNSSFSGNRAGAGGNAVTWFAEAGGPGGGLTSRRSTASLSNTTISGNSSGDGGDGGPSGSQGGSGGGVAIFNGSASLLNTTIADNTTGNAGSSSTMIEGPAGWGGGIALVDASMTLLHATVAGNRIGSGISPLGGGLFVVGLADPTATLTNSIVSGNSPRNCDFSGEGRILDGGHNISFPEASCPGATADPHLSPLQDGGGPTLTMALGAASAALDQVSAGCPATDQRGVPRPQGAACDIGAYELFVDVTAPLTTLTVLRQRLGRVLRKGYAARFTTNEAGNALLEVFTNVRKRRGAPSRTVRLRIASGSVAVPAPGQYRIVAKFTRKAKKRFARTQRLVVNLRLTVSDAAGNTTVKTKRLVLRR